MFGYRSYIVAKQLSDTSQGPGHFVFVFWASLDYTDFLGQGNNTTNTTTSLSTV